MPAEKNDGIIVRSITGLWRNLGSSVVAQGVATTEARDQLKTGQCAAAQGDCIARPVPAREFERRLREPPHGMTLARERGE